MKDMTLGRVEMALSLAEFVASLPKCPPDYFVGRYHHLHFDWFPFLRTRHRGQSPFSNGFADAIANLLADEPVEVLRMFFRAVYEATLNGMGYGFLRDTFGPHPTITLREARENAGMSDLAAAKMAQIDVRTLRHWEREGAHNAGAIKYFRLLRVYRISLDRVSIEPDAAAKGGEVNA